MRSNVSIILTFSAADIRLFSFLKLNRTDGNSIVSSDFLFILTFFAFHSLEGNSKTEALIDYYMYLAQKLSYSLQLYTTII